MMSTIHYLSPSNDSLTVLLPGTRLGVRLRSETLLFLQRCFLGPFQDPSSASATADYPASKQLFGDSYSAPT